MIRQFLFCSVIAVGAQTTISAPKSLAQAAASTWRPAASATRAQCFPIERLRPDLRPRAQAILLKALDGEALYTLIGGVKPMSSGWLSASSDGSPASVAKLEDMRQIVSCLRCGDEIVSHIHHFARVYDGRVALEGVMFGRDALSRAIHGRQNFWSRWAITPSSDPLEVVLATEYAPSEARFRGYGFLFGYPQHAVDFFVSASQQQEADPEKKLVPRDFLSIPTFGGPTNRFVYAVAKGQVPNAADIALRQKCAPILAEYRRRRARYIGPGKAGAFALLRDWFSDGRGHYSPRFARLSSVPSATSTSISVAAP